MSLRCSAVCVCVSASSADTYSQCSPRGSVIRVNHLPSPVRRQKRRVFSNHAGQLVGKGAGELCGSKIPERKREKKKARKRDILKLYVYLYKFSLVLLELKNHRRPFHLSIHPPSAFFPCFFLNPSPFTNVFKKPSLVSSLSTAGTCRGGCMPPIIICSQVL